MRAIIHLQFGSTRGAALLGSALLTLLFAGCRESGNADPEPPPTAPDDNTLTTEARTVVKRFAGEMQAALQEALSKGGPEKAPAVCREIAPAIASRLSSETGWTIGRTSAKLRNPANQPDDWEEATLALFAQDVSAGQDIATVEHFERTDGRFRYMKAIGVQGACLLCHGEALPGPVSEQIDALYPDDQARNYQAGDLRGAFTLSREIK